MRRIGYTPFRTDDQVRLAQRHLAETWREDLYVGPLRREPEETPPDEIYDELALAYIEEVAR
jgi:hypothetical protein